VSQQQKGGEGAKTSTHQPPLSSTLSFSINIKLADTAGNAEVRLVDHQPLPPPLFPHPLLVHIRVGQTVSHGPKPMAGNPGPALYEQRKNV